MAHRDLKPENFIFETKEMESDLKVIDFGLSNTYKTDETLKYEPYFNSNDQLYK